MRLLTIPKRLAAETEGAVAIIFALLLMPLTFAVGAAVDYSRASNVRADLQSATDAAALSLGKTAFESGKKADLELQAEKAFAAGFQRKDGATVTKVAVHRHGSLIAVEADVHVPLAFAGIIKGDGVKLKARSEVMLGMTDLEVALVLDNTGSMAEGGKMGALKRAAKGLVDKLEAASATNPNISIAIVPFDTFVNVKVTNPYPDWLQQALLEKQDRDGDQDFIKWQGCITDRDQPYDVRGTLPSTSLAGTLYPAIDCKEELKPILPLTRDFKELSKTLSSMTPNGYTNTTIGLAWGLNALTPGAPMSGKAEAPRPGLRKHIVFLTDGENTKNRWTQNRAQIDARTALVCDEIKKSGISLHTIRVVEGNEPLLKNCASDPSMYHSVTNASDLGPVFDRIATQLIAMRLSY
jgi:Flp pilus assembly protein TadG